VKLIDNRGPGGFFIREALLFSPFDKLLVGNLLPGFRLKKEVLHFPEMPPVHSWTPHWSWYQCGAVDVRSRGEERSESARPDEQNGGQLATQGSNIILSL
jgi:hypothetical protein